MGNDEDYVCMGHEHHGMNWGKEESPDCPKWGQKIALLLHRKGSIKLQDYYRVIPSLDRYRTSYSLLALPSMLALIPSQQKPRRLGIRYCGAGGGLVLSAQT